MHTALDFGLGYLFVQCPYLDWWPLNSLIRWLFGMVEGKVWSGICTLINVYYVPFKNDLLQKRYADSILALRQEALNSGIGSPSYQTLRQQNSIAFAAHVRSLLVEAA